jgi:hypothetical protein
MSVSWSAFFHANSTKTKKPVYRLFGMSWLIQENPDKPPFKFTTNFQIRDFLLKCIDIRK